MQSPALENLWAKTNDEAEVGSIRGDFAQVTRFNSIHGSDCKEVQSVRLAYILLPMKFVTIGTLCLN